MIHEIQIGAIDAKDHVYYEPPTRMLKLSVIGGEAYLVLHPTDLEEDQPDAQPLCSFQVPARSLLLALQAALDDDQNGQSNSAQTTGLAASTPSASPSADHAVPTRRAQSGTGPTRG